MRTYARVPPNTRKAKIYFIVALSSFIASMAAAVLGGWGMLRMDVSTVLARGLGIFTIVALFKGLDAIYGIDPTRWAEKPNDPN